MGLVKVVHNGSVNPPLINLSIPLVIQISILYETTLSPAEDQISFVHDGSNRPPSYSVSVRCLDSLIGPFPAYVTFDALQVPLVLVNQAVISQGQRLVFSDQNLLGNSDPSQNSAFIFLHCHFETISSPNIPITNFNPNQLNTGQILLVDDNSLESPSYSGSLTNTILSHMRSVALATAASSV